MAAVAATTSYPYADDQMSVAQWREWSTTCSGRTSGVVYQGLSLEVFADSTGMQCKVRSGKAHLEGSYGSWTSTTTLAIASAPVTSGFRRIDRVIIRSDLTGGRMELDVLTGTAVNSSTTPTAPALTNDTDTIEQSIGQVFVQQGDATIQAGDITDERTFVRSASGWKPGDVRFWPSNNAIPPGFEYADGVAVSRVTYAELALVIDPAGSSATFAKPDYRGEVLSGLDNFSSGAAGRLTGMASLTTHYGSQTHVLTYGEIPHNVVAGGIVIANGAGSAAFAERPLDLAADPHTLIQPTHMGYWLIACRPTA